MRGRALIKIMGLSLLAAVGLMAVTASAAQAKWLKLLNKASVNSLKLSAEMLPGSLYIPEIDMEIHCTGGTASVTTNLSGGSTVLSGSGSAEFTGCAVRELEVACTVHSPGQPDGTIVAEGSGTAGMNGAEEVFSNLESAEFTEFYYEGEECPLAELDQTISGTVKVTLLEALKDLTTHLVHLDDVSLQWGELEAVLFGEEEGSAILGHVKDENPTATWALHLVEL